MISLLMNVYNEETEWLIQAVESILNQTYQNFEIIIVIDNPELSIENKNYLLKVSKNDERVKFLFNSENQGTARCANLGLEMAKGDYIARLDADDIAMPERFEVELDYFDHNNIDMVASNVIIIDRDGREIYRRPKNTEDPMKYLPYTNMILHSSVMIKTSVLRELGGYRNFRSGEDYDLWLRMITKDKKIAIIDQYLVKYRIRDNGISIQNRLKQYYSNKYIAKLYNERLKVGKDSFSEENLQKYLSLKKITDKKNKRCVITMELLFQAKRRLSDKKISFIMPLAKAFILFPSVTLSVMTNVIKKSHVK